MKVIQVDFVLSSSMMWCRIERGRKHHDYVLDAHRANRLAWVCRALLMDHRATARVYSDGWRIIILRKEEQNA